MSAPVVRGSFANFRQSQSWDFDPQRGFIYRAEYKGIGAVNMAALQASYVAAGIAHRLTEHQDIYTLEAEDATQAYTIDSWQIVGNEESRDGFSHPALLNVFAEIPGAKPYDAIIHMRECLADNKTTDDAFSTEELAGSPLLAKMFYELAIRGGDQYRHEQYVLRHTTNAPNRWGVNIADIGVGKVYTTAQLLTECQDSSLWALPMPGRLAYKLSAIPSPTPIINYLWGWLKGASTETTAANNRVDINSEYILAQWPIQTYYEAF